MTPKKPCSACKIRIKNWRGDDPRCAFGDGGSFTPDNWNCATANLIRDLCHPENSHPAVDHRYCGDQSYATVNIDGIDLPDSGEARSLWVSWYKQRGCTEAMWLLSERAAPTPPSEGDCLAILAALTNANAVTPSIGKSEPPPGWVGEDGK